MNTDSCQISVIIPIYNNSPLITLTLNSIVKQSFKGFEIILVDDGSTDNSIELARKVLENTDLKFSIIQQENSGVSCARNKGLENANGDYIYFLDGDDQVEPECLESLFLRMVEFEADVVVCSYDVRTSDGKVQRTFDKRFSYSYESISGPKYAELVLKHKTWACTGTILWRKSFLDKTGVVYTQGAFNGQDVEFTLKNLSQASRVSCVDSVLMHYIIYDSSRNSRARWRRFHSVGCYLRLEKFLANNTTNEQLIKLVSARAIPLSYIEVINHLILNGISNEEFFQVIKHPYVVRRISSGNLRLLGFRKYLLTLVIVRFPRVYYAFFFRRFRKLRKSLAL
ncbi:MAG: glycosyltransferase family 2 protein [SAR324 cluster bacterium]|uniref:Glycosyltransferase family 2 protein n=1 Tax=SAR324 cluster bacterium TaxID=2024889 RepID=A0A7X9FQK6_9DELT|nr:glycosyltransferase family 2 protein [SAR324 cluster bacterium]